jgi:uncharacterized protein YecT (DUF1311 family)
LSRSNPSTPSTMNRACQVHTTGFASDPEGGSAARVTATECFLNATADRAKELRLLTNDQ